VRKKASLTYFCLLQLGWSSWQEKETW